MFAHISFLESIILASVTLAYLYPVIQTEIHRHIYSARVTNLANPRPLINPDKTLPRVRIYGYMEKKNLLLEPAQTYSMNPRCINGPSCLV